MVRNMVLVALVFVGAMSQVKACDACAKLFQQTEGKLVKKAISLPIPNDPTLRLPIKDFIVGVVWELRTADKKVYTLNLTSRTAARQAQILEGRDVLVVGPRKGNTIAVREIEAKEMEFTGTLEKIVGKNATTWRLLEGGASSRIHFASHIAACHAHVLAGKKVKVKAQMTISGLMVHSVEAMK